MTHSERYHMTVPRSSPHARLFRSRGLYPTEVWGTSERYEYDASLSEELGELGWYRDPYPWPKRRWPTVIVSIGAAGTLIAVVALGLWGDEKQATAPEWSTYVILFGMGLVLAAFVSWAIASRLSRRTPVPPWTAAELAAMEDGTPHAVPDGAPAPPPPLMPATPAAPIPVSEPTWRSDTHPLTSPEARELWRRADTLKKRAVWAGMGAQAAAVLVVVALFAIAGDGLLDWVMANVATSAIVALSTLAFGTIVVPKAISLVAAHLRRRARTVEREQAFASEWMRPDQPAEPHEPPDRPDRTTFYPDGDTPS